jgi:DNA-binding response OmpR family regulator
VPVVLVVEDDPRVRSALIRELTRRSYVVRSADSALSALREVAADPPDLVVLDLGLPDLDGSQVLQMMHGLQDIPVIIASGRQDDAEVVRLLKAGADDYLVKPYSADQLEARVAAVLRRSARATANAVGTEPLTVGQLIVDPAARSAELAGVSIELTRLEFDLLAYLAARPGQVVSRRELLSEVWRQSYGQSQTIDVHVSLLRRKLGESASTPRYLHTVRGVGVRLNAP